MQSEMPKKYWKNLPEASLIAGLIAAADKDHAVTMTDAETGTYYIVRDSRSSGGSR